MDQPGTRRETNNGKDEFAGKYPQQFLRAESNRVTRVDAIRPTPLLARRKNVERKPLDIFAPIHALSRTF